MRVERCCKCDDATGRAGKADDSLYRDDGTGPYCEGCFAMTDLAALRLDAERYRWIDEHGLTELLVALEKNPRSLDETIDSAMKEEGK